MKNSVLILIYGIQSEEGLLFSPKPRKIHVPHKFVDMDIAQRQTSTRFYVLWKSQDHGEE
ncbi:hypothetical protein NC652_023662 [Populus alba x Populus x berolinensis]|nr:hypothetical protein NC652_023662 [Populus alba x Populus x berolinensis]